jgi:nucleoporin NUP159
MLVHTPSVFDQSQPPTSVFHIATKSPPSNFTFQTVPEVAGPWGLNRSPPHHFFLRLRDFPPNLQDMLIVASTASADIGVFTRTKVSLAPGAPVEVFTMTEMADDSRRAQLPMNMSLTDTSPIGFALDLSSKEKVMKPIPSDEIDESSTPLPALMVLNNEGVLASWWIVYTDSVRQGTIYSGLILNRNASATAPAVAPAQIAQQGFPAQSQPAFGAPTSTGGFGTPSSLAPRPSAWVSSPAVTQPAFGNTSTPTFGGPSVLGATSTPAFGSSGFAAPKSSPWAKPAASSTVPLGPSGGFASFASKPTGFAAVAASSQSSVFGGNVSPAPQSSIFTTPINASQQSVFGSKTATAPQNSVFGTSGRPSLQNVFGNASNSIAPQTSVFGTPNQPQQSIFGANPSSSTQMTTAGPFGNRTNNFKLESSFKPDQFSSNETEKPSTAASSSFFGSNFGSILTDNAKSMASPTNDSEMDSTEDAIKSADPAPLSSSALISEPGATLKAPTTGGLFSGSSSSSTPASKPSFDGLFGQPSPINPTQSTQPPSTHFGFGGGVKEAPKASFGFGDLNTASMNISKPALSSANTLKDLSSPKIKEESSSTKVIGDIPEAPLPPDTYSKTSYQAGDTSVSSMESNASIPPEPPKTFTADMIPPSDVPGGPEDEEESDFLESGEDEGSEPLTDDEGSGEDVTKDQSPVSDTIQISGITPESSFGGLKAGQSPENPFNRVDKQPRSLFGEVGTTAPVLPPPNLRASPRSPSPIRSAIPGLMLRSERPDPSRSVSAPNAASRLLGSHRISDKQAAPAVPSQSTYTISVEERKAEEMARATAKERQEAIEARSLIDEDDLRLQKYLSTGLNPTKTLSEFNSHSEPTSQSSLDSIPDQVEAVYRDINSMIDSLGLNARSLKEFTIGNENYVKVARRTREDLDSQFEDHEEGWCLVEIEQLSRVVEEDLTQDLQNGCIKDMDTKLEVCHNLQKDLGRLHAKYQDIEKLIAFHHDPDQVAVARAQPLSAEQAAQQHDLRRDFTNFQRLLSEAEEGLFTLKAKIVAKATTNSTSNSAGPTIEAVTRTILKMTSIAEKKSGDIDVLEGQMRKLRFSSTASIGSREGSPFTTPRSTVRNPGSSSTYGLFYTPDSIRDDRRGFQNSLMSSTGSFSRGSPDRKKLSGYSHEEKTLLREKLARKKEVTDRLRAAMRKSGTRVRRFDDEE